MSVVVHRVDRKAIPLGRRAAFSVASDEVVESLCSQAGRIGDAVVVLNTCERFEVYLASPSPAVRALLRVSPIAPDVVVNRNDDAIRHLFRVASGLESRHIGEVHVLGQVRAAIEDARRCGTVSRDLDVLFRRALECGRRVRAAAAFAADSAGYTARAIDRLHEQLGTLAGRRVLVVGTGALAGDVAQSLRSAGVTDLTIAGRHAGRVLQLAERLDARSISVAALHSIPTRFDAIVTAVAAAVPIITAETLLTCTTTLLVDLGATPNVSAEVRAMPGVRVFGLDDLGGAAVLASSLARATDFVERELARYRTTIRRPSVSITNLPRAS